MIIEIVWFMFALAFLFLFLGYSIKVPYVVMMGWIMIFLLSIGFVNGVDIEYKTGIEEFYQYGSNFSNSVHWDEDHPSEAPTFNPQTEPIYLFHITETDIYSNYSNNIIFLYLALISGLGFVSVFFTKDLW